MNALLDSRVVRGVAWALAAVGVALVALGLGRYTTSQPALVLVAGVAVLALGVTAVEPAAIPLMAMPVLLVSFRVGGGSVDLSASDAALGLATLAALVFAPRPFSRELRNLLWLDAAYQFATLFTVLANPFASGVVEWFHAWMLVSGALIVGWTVARRGYARLGINLLVGMSLILAVITLVHAALQYARGDFSAVYLTWPFGMHKNFAGTVLAFAAIIAYLRPAWLGWPRSRGLGFFWILVAGLAVTQSRQAILGLGVSIVLILIRRDAIRRRSRLILLVILPALVLVWVMVQDQLQSGNRANSVFTRLNWFAETIAFWLEDPWFGHGLRFWYQPGSEIGYQPPNALLEVLASAGIVGTVAFVVLMVATLAVLWGLDRSYGDLAVAILVSRLVQGQLDLFWIAVQVSIPFVVVGICLGAAARNEPARLHRTAGSAATAKGT